MFNQTFHITDIVQVFFLGFIEFLLSADNAIVIAILVKKLEPKFRSKALFIGITSAFIIRIFALLTVPYLANIWIIEILGAFYLFYLSFFYFFKERRFEHPEKKTTLIHFWTIILLIELIDIAFAFDSLVGALAFIAPYAKPDAINPKLWFLYLGGLIGILGIRYGAEIFSRLMDLFPRIEDSAHIMISWIGLRLIIDAIFQITGTELIPPIYLQIIFWIGIIIIFILGLILKKSKYEKKRSR